MVIDGKFFQGLFARSSRILHDLDSFYLDHDLATFSTVEGVSCSIIENQVRVSSYKNPRRCSRNVVAERYTFLPETKEVKKKKKGMYCSANQDLSTIDYNILPYSTSLCSLANPQLRLRYV